MNRWNLRLFRMFLYLGLVCIFVSCQATDVPAPTTAPSAVYPSPAATAPANAQKENTMPFMFKEAALPRDFPPPGPVGQVIVKHYPAYRAAWTTAPEQGDVQGKMFGSLFRHIQSNKIKMTAPVEMTYASQDVTATSQPAAMAFMYQQPEMGTAGKQGNVEVRDMQSMTVLSITVRGNYTTARMKEALDQLHDFMNTQTGRFTVAGQPRYLGYNSPFVPWFLRLGEVQLPVLDSQDATPAKMTQ